MTRIPKHATLSEVARAAGVGTTTVSRVINGGQKVDPKTLERVRRAIEQLGYMPNQAARILKGGRTRTIGLLIPSIADPFFSACAEAAESIARRHDSLLIVTTTHNDPKIELESVHVLTRHRADGLIIAPADSGGDVLRALLGRLGVPVVAMDRPLPGAAIPSVLADNFAGAQLATRHLLEHGYRRIACLTGEPMLYTIAERMRGYRQTMKSAGLEPMLDISIADYSSARHAIEKLLSVRNNAPEALLTLKNSTTIYAFEALQEMKVAIPEQIALLGYDDFELAATVRPAITVIQQPIQEMGRVAAELLFEHLQEPGKAAREGHDAPRQHIQLETRLVRRNSCGCGSAPV